MKKHYNVHFTKGALPPRSPTEHCFLGQEPGHQKGRSSDLGGQVSEGLLEGGAERDVEPHLPFKRLVRASGSRQPWG